MRLVSYFMSLLLTAAAALAADAPAQCKDSPAIVAPCFVVHGRLSVYQGSLNHRIWPVGSHRLLAVVDGADVYDDEKPPLPEFLESPIEKFGSETRLFADYRVCPLTRPRPGHMQHVCIVGASHIFVIKPH